MVNHAGLHAHENSRRTRGALGHLEESLQKEAFSQLEKTGMTVSA